MKGIIVTTVISFALACVSCTGVYFPYLNEQNEPFVKIDRPFPPHDWSLSMWGDKKKVGGSTRFNYTISISLIEERCVSLNLHSLYFFDDKGDTIPLEITYGTVYGIDSLKLSVSSNSASAIIYDTTRKVAIFYFNATCTRPVSSVKIKYDFDVNGESVRGECLFRKRVMIESKPRLPGQPWFL